MPLSEEESEYEKQRRLRIAENQAMIESLFPQNARPAYTNLPKKNNSVSVKRRRAETTISVPRRRLPKRRARSFVSKYESENDGEDAEDEGDADDSYSPPNMIVKLWPEQARAHRRSSSSHSEDSICLPRPKRRAYRASKQQPKPVVEITEKDLILVADRVADKKYDTKNGTTCHQCRQKTDDLKTVCKNPDCCGTRGQFCGPCLRNRYGEDAKKALMEPTWYCPPCRGICNCSFCMPKRGFKCTGILIHVAKECGYADVKSFLGD